MRSGVRKPLRRWIAILGIGGATLAMTGPLKADVLILRNGSRLEGQVKLQPAPDAKPEGVKGGTPPKDPAKTPGASYLVKLPSGALIGVPQYDVKQWIVEAEALTEYRQRVAAAGDSAEAHWELSKWCRSQGLHEQARRHIERVVVLDPENGTARAALDQAKFQGKWIPKDQMQRLRGLVYHEGAWQVPEITAINNEQQTAEAAVRVWRQKLKQIRKEIPSARFGAKAMAELRAIQDPTAALALAELVVDPKESLELREIYLQLLSQWDTPPVFDALLTLSFSDEPRLRERALEMISEKAPRRAGEFFTYSLQTLASSSKPEDADKVDRAAVALARVPQSDSIPRLIDALVTKHTFLENPQGGGNVNSSFNNQGGGSFGFGGKPQKVNREIQHQSVLSALLSLVPAGVNYQFDETAWRVWYAQRAEYPYDLRRDP